MPCKVQQFNSSPMSLGALALLFVNLWKDCWRTYYTIYLLTADLDYPKGFAIVLPLLFTVGRSPKASSTHTPYCYNARKARTSVLGLDETRMPHGFMIPHGRMPSFVLNPIWIYPSAKIHVRRPVLIHLGRRTQQLSVIMSFQFLWLYLYMVPRFPSGLMIMYIHGTQSPKVNRNLSSRPGVCAGPAKMQSYETS